VRVVTAKLLRERGALTVETAEQLMSDADIAVRFEAVQSLIASGKLLSEETVKQALVMPPTPGGLGSFSDDTYWIRFREQRLAALPDTDLERLSDFFDRTAEFILSERRFASRGDNLRQSVRDHFKAEFIRSLDDVEGKYGTAAIGPFRDLDEWLRKKFTRQGLDVICRKGARKDLGLVRDVLESGFVGYSDADIEFLRKFGEWEDIRLIIASVQRPSFGAASALLIGSDSAKYRLATRAIYSMGRTRFAELLRLDAPSRLIALLIIETADTTFQSLSNAAIAALFQSENASIRKAAALKSVRAFPKGRIRQVLDAYVSAESYYYNVVHWLDLGVSLPRDRALAAARKELRKMWEE
jgi:hypothetical protein